MYFDEFRFGSIEIDGVTYEHDLVIDRGDIRKRRKKPSKQFSAVYGHTPLPLLRVFPGAAGAWSSVRVLTVLCRSWKRSSKKPGHVRLSCWCFPRLRRFKNWLVPIRRRTPSCM